jgi:amidase
MPPAAFADATGMLAALAARQISAIELLEQHIARISRHNPALNAIIIADYDGARRAAAAADDARTRGLHAPLLGLPLTLKDCIDVAELRSTAGALELANYYATADAPLTARLRAAGAVIIGKTNMASWAADWQTNNPVFGRTNNPWNIAYTPGGSTGGGAAAVAAGLTPLEFGSDIGGSIRIPAAFCGVYGHKPSETAVPRSGIFPGSPHPNAAIALSVAGPLARSAGDLALALDVIAGADHGEDAAWRLAIPPARHARLADFRVALLPALHWLPVEGAITVALAELAAQLRRAGAVVEEAQPARFGDLRDYYKLYLAILWAMLSAGQPAPERQRRADELRATDNEFLIACAHGMLASAADYIGWHSQREQYREDFRRFFRSWDVLLAPVNIVNAYPHLDAPGPQPFRINDQDVRYDRQNVYPAIASLSGQPATAFPVGLTQTGLPISIQVIGPYLEDRTPIQFAALVAQLCGGFHPPPGFEA